jgi:hypothetical protein
LARREKKLARREEAVS